MNQLPKKITNFCMALTVAAGMAGLAATAQSPDENHNAAQTARDTARTARDTARDTARKAERVSKESVRAAQEKLKDAGFYSSNVDGLMGPKTRAAIRKYQEQNKLATDGRLDQKTAESLGIAKPGDYFESAGGDISRHYKNAGSEVKDGTKGMASRMKDGEVGSGVAKFGKGVWNGAKSVGKGTANAAKDAYHGTKKAVVPNESGKTNK